jgi:pimeloyl-ACP methyl ester carboxylesterase
MKKLILGIIGLVLIGVLLAPHVNYANIRIADALTTTAKPSSDSFSADTSNTWIPQTQNGFPRPPPEINFFAPVTGAPMFKIGVGGSLDMLVGDSTDGFDVVQVRFSSDDILDGYPRGVWTSWDDWQTSSMDWNAATKMKTWHFATGGFTEVWVERKDTKGNLHLNSIKVQVYVPILLVHGFQRGDFFSGNWDLDEAWRNMCVEFTGRDPEGQENIDWLRVYENSAADIDYSMKRLEGNGYVVYISNYSHTQARGTHDTIENYAKELANEIQVVKQYDNVSKVDIVAHSMGGLISRTYIEDDGLIDIPFRGDVRKLIMLGTPNQGLSQNVIFQFFGISFAGLADYLSVPQMFSDSGYSDFLDILNSDNNSSDAPGVEYSGIAGNITSSGPARDSLGGIAVESVYLPEIPRPSDRWAVINCHHNNLPAMTGSIVKDIIEGRPLSIPSELIVPETKPGSPDIISPW